MTWMWLKQLLQGIFLPLNLLQSIWVMQTRYKDCCGIHEWILPPLIAMRPVHDGWTTNCKVHQRVKIPHSRACDPPWRISIDEAYNKAMKIERLQSRALPFKSEAERTFSSAITLQDSASGEWPSGRKATDAPSRPYSKPSDDSRPHCKRQGESMRQARCWQVLHVWWTWRQVQWVPEEKTSQHERL